MVVSLWPHFFDPLCAYSMFVCACLSSRFIVLQCVSKTFTIYFSVTNQPILIILLYRILKKLVCFAAAHHT